MRNKHDESRALTCPICLKVFGNEQGIRAHQKRKRHLTHHYVDEPWAKYAGTNEAPVYALEKRHD